MFLSLNQSGLLYSSLCSSSLSRIEDKLQGAINQQTRAPDLMEMVDEMDDLTPLNPAKRAPAYGPVIYSQASAVGRTSTETTLYEPARIRAESSPSPSDSSSSEFDASKSGIAHSHYITAPGMDSRQRLVMNTDQDSRALSVSSTAQEEYSVTSIKSDRSRRRSLTSL